VIDGLLAGVYDGDLTVGMLRQHGDFGIGTFNALDGEMVVHDGVVYRVRFDGSVHVVPDSERTPLGFVTFFQPTQTIALDGALTLPEVQAELARRLRTNALYAIEIRGRFATVGARAPEPATPPYPELAEYLGSHQRKFALADSEGVAIGFVMPPYLGRVNVPGVHLHYLANDHRSGGHVLDFRSDGALAVRVMELTGVNIEISQRPELYKADLTRDRQREVKQVETGGGKQ
jgi:acetolactate decarboxylase